MSSATATVNGVELTEAQVRDALAQIETAKASVYPCNQALYILSVCIEDCGRCSGYRNWEFTS